MALLLDKSIEDLSDGMLVTASFDKTIKVRRRCDERSPAHTHTSRWHDYSWRRWGATAWRARHEVKVTQGAAASGSGLSQVWQHSVTLAAASGAAFASSGAAPPPGGSWVHEQTLEGHTNGVMSLALSRSRRLLFSGSNDSTVCAWSLATGAKIAQVRVVHSP